MPDVCPKCGRKQFNPSTRKCYACGAETRKDGSLIDVPKGYFKDENDNIRSPNHYEIKDEKLFVSYHYVLEEGKTTLRGEHPKLASPPKCVHPERLSCNYGDGFDRCEFMKYFGEGFGGHWACDSK